MTTEEFLKHAPVRLEDLAPGAAVAVDGGFTCMEPSTTTVCADAQGNLFVPCRCGEHALDGQVGEDGILVGVRLIAGAAA